MLFLGFICYTEANGDKQKRTGICRHLDPTEGAGNSLWPWKIKAQCPDQTMSQSQIEVYEYVLWKKLLFHLLHLAAFALHLHPRHPAYFHTSNTCNYVIARLFPAKVMKQLFRLWPGFTDSRNFWQSNRNHMMFTEIGLGRTCSDFYFHFNKSVPACSFCLTSIVFVCSRLCYNLFS